MYGLKVKCFAVVGLLSAACGSDYEPFVDPENPTATECRAIEERWRAEAALIDRSCSTEDDCIVVGGTVCDGGRVTLGACEGNPFNAVAYQAAQGRLTEAASGWSSCTCDLVDCVIDCQKGNAVCEDGVCVSYEFACF